MVVLELRGGNVETRRQCTSVLGLLNEQLWRCANYEEAVVDMLISTQPEASWLKHCEVSVHVMHNARPLRYKK